MAHNLGTHFGCMEPRNVCWAHGVNSSEALDVALADKSCHMIEADLMIRGASTRSSKAAARWKAAGSSTGALTARDVIMCHPPAVDSDLTFDQFFKRVFLAVKAGRRVGLKLDFKDADAVLPCVRLLRDSNVGIHDASYVGAHASTRTMPLWLNADVIRGPGGRPPIPGEQFVARCLEHCPSATLSLGWTTSGTPRLGYSRRMVDEMRALTANVRAHVTFAPSAAHLFASAEGPRASMIAMLVEDAVNDRGTPPAAAEAAVKGPGVRRPPAEDAVDADADLAPATPSLSPSKPAPGGEQADIFSVLSAAISSPAKATAPSSTAPRTITVWGPATPRVRRWFLNALPANKTYVDVKPTNVIESAVIGAHVAMRPLYARMFR
jgi:hypothetical protein|mmetsp:Transcript_15783/g.66524  ORF Transcript_15783/g.66524 Transcript_15783/m.66524 type:complete len:380 (+) Transcript_15783:300-1439(+)